MYIKKLKNMINKIDSNNNTLKHIYCNLLIKKLYVNLFYYILFYLLFSNSFYYLFVLLNNY